MRTIDASQNARRIADDIVIALAERATPAYDSFAPKWMDLTRDLLAPMIDVMLTNERQRAASIMDSVQEYMARHHPPLPPIIDWHAPLASPREAHDTAVLLCVAQLEPAIKKARELLRSGSVWVDVESSLARDAERKQWTP